jgi:hypothetical protein
MAANKKIRFGPVALGAAAANILNPPTVSGGVGVAPATTNTYILLKHIRVVNKTAGAVSFTLFIGATGGSAAGTEFGGFGKSVPANDAIDMYFADFRLDVADFLTGLASAATSLTIEGEGELGAA